MATAISKIGAILTFEDGSTVTVHEDDILTGIVYQQGKHTLTIDSGRVRVLVGRTNAYNGGSNDCPPEPYLAPYVIPTQLIIDHSDDHKAQITRIDVVNIQAIGEVTSPEDVVEEGTIVVGPGPAFKSLSEVIENAEPGSTIKLQNGEYTEPLTITKSVKLVAESQGYAVFTAPVVVNPVATAAAEGEAEKIEVVFDGLSFSGKASIDVKKADVLTIKNCVIGGYDFETRTNPIKMAEVPILLTIDNNLFTENCTNVYNLIECLGILENGSAITNNSFETGDCAHNSINLYNVANNAHINMENNLFGFAVNVMRIGFKGAPTGVMVNMIDNVVEGMTAGVVWSGMYCIQPYSTKTTSMAGVTINMENNKIDREYVAYLYAAPKDTQWNPANKPTILLDGKKFDIPDISAEVNG